MHTVQIGPVIHFQGNMVNPFRGIWAGLRRYPVSQIEEGDMRIIFHAEKDMHIRAVLTGAGDMIVFNHMDQR
ncbi:hypothetical protein D3C71_2188480 [compost metagenome]